MALNLQKVYGEMWNKALLKFKRGEFEYDPWLNRKGDKRYGLTLLARPDERTKTKIAGILDAFRRIEPGQYYYPPSDIHLTVLSIISCREGFSLSEIDAEAYVRTIENALAGKRAFPIHYRGLTASPDCILVQGFPKTQELSRIRDDIRDAFKAGPLPHSIDSRYRLETAHSTVARFREPITQPEQLIEQIRLYRDIPLGAFLAGELELVYNDWYQKAEHTIVLEKFSLLPRRAL